ncbi:hypothetical protein T01_6805 [Trichinella spiralis]|uniref:Uncharacterized protein n=1 Tax=Trichinella spiralis TaxID=6334 RepID=A0A0V1BJU3_TRISP|nr:hypothetical protein T01_6805 [Trichinella spiralis]
MFQIVTIWALCLKHAASSKARTSRMGGSVFGEKYKANKQAQICLYKEGKWMFKLLRTKLSRVLCHEVTQRVIRF